MPYPGALSGIVAEQHAGPLSRKARSRKVNVKKKAVTVTVAGALGGLAALGLVAGPAPADPKFPAPPLPPIPAPPIPDVEVPRLEVPRGPEVNLPPGQLPPAPDVNLPPGQIPQLPDVNVPAVAVPGPGDLLPDLLPDVANVDDFFRLPHIPPGQLKNSAMINGVRNPFFGIPPGQLKKLSTVQ